MKTKIFFLSVLLSVFSLGYSQESGSLDSLLEMSLEEIMNIQISGVSRYKQSITEVPNSTQVITAQQIYDRGYQDLSDLLKDINGFDVVDNAGRFGEFYGFRGIEGNDRFLILINGQKINPASGIFVSIGNSIFIRHAERVEIIYGTASAVYGADAYSGIINIIYAEAKEEEKLSLVSSFNYGSMNTTDANIDISYKINENISTYLMARLYKSDGPDYIDDSNELYNYELISTYPEPLQNTFEQPTNDHTIYFMTSYKNFSLNYFRKQFDEGNALGFVPTIYIYNKENRWKNSTDIIWLTYNKKTEKNGNFTFNISNKRYMIDKNTLFYKWSKPMVFDATKVYEQFMTGKDNTILAVATYNQVINEHLQFISGLDNEYSSMIPAYANDEVLGQSYKYDGENKAKIDSSLTMMENRSSAFGQIVYSPISIFNFTFGARYDYSTRYGGVFNPRLGIVSAPSKLTNIKFIYGRAFQAPSLFFQYEQWGAPTITNISMTEIQKTDETWKLENQIINTYEFSINQTITKNVNLKIAVYYNDLTNVIEQNIFTDSVYNKYFNNYTTGLRNENIGRQKIIGSDILLNTKISKNIFWYLYYSYTDANSHRENTVSRPVPRIAEHKVWTGITFQNIFKYLTFSARFKYVTDLYNMNNQLFPDNKQPGYYMLDANLSINNLSKYFRIYADGENLFNQYIEHGGLYEQSGIYTAVIPQQGFTFKAGIEIFFVQNK